MKPPRYEHDCNSCVYLGQFKEYDLYCCGTTWRNGTVIARYSSIGSEYKSGLVFNESIALVEAKKRAYKFGIDFDGIINSEGIYSDKKFAKLYENSLY